MTTTNADVLTLDQRRARMLLALEGLSVGDAFGERFFGTEPALRAPRAEQRVPPDDGGRPWRWTDDTAMSVSVVEELWANERVIEASLAGDRVNPVDVARAARAIAAICSSSRGGVLICSLAARRPCSAWTPQDARRRS